MQFMLAEKAMRFGVEAGLVLGASVAVLAFGGTAPQFFALTEVIILALGILLVAAGGVSLASFARLPILLPGILIGLAALQILPLPAFLAGAFSGRNPGASSYFTISVAPYDTVSSLLLLVTCITAFYLVLVLCEDRKARKRIVFWLLGIGTFEAFYGLIQYLTGWQQIFGYVKKYYLQDATGTYVNRNHFAGLLEIVLPFAVALALQQGRRLRRNEREVKRRTRESLSSTEFFLLMFWVFLAAILFAALFFSRSRMGIIAAFVSVGAVLALAGSSSLSVKARLAVGALFLVGVCGLAVWIGSDPVIRRFETLGHEYAGTGQDRVSIWRDTLHLIRAHPLLGTGLGTFATSYTSVQTAFLSLLVDHAHNDYLEFAAELGIPGAMLLFGAVFWTLWLMLKHSRRAREGLDKSICTGCFGSITAVLVHSVADFNLHIPANALVFAIVLALGWSTVRHQE